MVLKGWAIFVQPFSFEAETSTPFLFTFALKSYLYFENGLHSTEKY